MTNFDIYNGDFMTWLDEYNPDESGYFHALLADPPYALIENSKRFKNADSAAPDPDYAGGAYTRQAKGFMGQTWDGFKSLKHYQEWVTSWAAKLPRIMYPGAIVAVFGGSRTFHRLAVGLEDGGLEVFDCLMWVYGSGMPKSLNIGRAIDKRSGVEAGKKRRVKFDGTPSNSTRPGTSVAHNDWGDKDLAYIDFVTPDAQRWSQHGTLLKPAYEPIILARIPRGKRSFIDLATQFQTGALNIGKARISTGDSLAGGETTRGAPTPSGDGWSRPFMENPTDEKKAYAKSKVEQAEALGRYPSNVLMSHSPGCKFLGYEELKSRESHIRHISDSGDKHIFKENQRQGTTDTRPGGSDGVETREVWDCMPGCPVAQMDEQSGLSEPSSQTEKTPSGSRRMNFGFSDDYTAPNYSDSGGASRFFYTGKASPQERLLPGYLQPSRQLKKAARAALLEEMNELEAEPQFGTKDIFRKDWVPLDMRWKFEPARATHPTVKPIDLVTYLAGLLLPPDGGQPRRLLIPFSGVGSEMIGAHFAGWEYIQGVELTAAYIPQALDRLRFWSKSPTYESAISGYNQNKDIVKKDRLQRAAEDKAGVKRLPLFPELERPP